MRALLQRLLANDSPADNPPVGVSTTLTPPRVLGVNELHLEIVSIIGRDIDGHSLISAAVWIGANGTIGSMSGRYPDSKKALWNAISAAAELQKKTAVGLN